MHTSYRYIFILLLFKLIFLRLSKNYYDKKTQNHREMFVQAFRISWAKVENGIVHYTRRNRIQRYKALITSKIGMS